MTRAIVAILGLVVLAMVAVSGFQLALEDAGRDIIVTNETWTPDAGNVTQLDDSGRNGAYYADNVTVYDENDTEMDRGTDYDWIETNGTVKAVVGGDLDGDSDAKITYSYQQTTAEQRDIAAMLGLVLPEWVGLLLPMLALVVALLLLKGG